MLFNLGEFHLHVEKVVAVLWKADTAVSCTFPCASGVLHCTHTFTLCRCCSQLVRQMWYLGNWRRSWTTWQELGLFCFLFFGVTKSSEMLITKSVCLTVFLGYLFLSDGPPCGVRQSLVVRKPCLPIGSCCASICSYILNGYLHPKPRALSPHLALPSGKQSQRRCDLSAGLQNPCSWWQAELQLQVISI